MTDLLDQAVKRVRQLLPERQDAFAHMLLDCVRDEQGLAPWTAEQIADIEAGLADADPGDFLSDREVEAMYEGFKRRAQ